MKTCARPTNPSYIRRAVLALGFEKVRVAQANGDVFVKDAGKWRFYATTEQVTEQIAAAYREKFGKDARRLLDAAA